MKGNKRFNNDIIVNDDEIFFKCFELYTLININPF